MMNLEILKTNMEVLEILREKDRNRKECNGVWYIFQDNLENYTNKRNSFSDDNYNILIGMLWGFCESDTITDKLRKHAIEELINYYKNNEIES